MTLEQLADTTVGVRVYRGRPYGRITMLREPGAPLDEVWIISAQFAFHGAMLDLYGEGDTIAEAITAIERQLALAESSL